MCSSCMGQLAVVDRQSLAINQTAAGGGAFLEEDGSARCLFPGVITHPHGHQACSQRLSPRAASHGEFLRLGSSPLQTDPRDVALCRPSGEKAIAGMLPPASTCPPRPLRLCVHLAAYANVCRWQVADLGEAGRNVNGWHWTEKDALPWCRDRLQGATTHHRASLLRLVPVIPAVTTS